MPRTRGRHIPLLVTAPGFGWINAYTVASEIGDIERFASPAKLCGQVSRRHRFRLVAVVSAAPPRTAARDDTRSCRPVLNSRLLSAAEQAWWHIGYVPEPPSQITRSA
jgi:hypothetical protein